MSALHLSIPHVLVSQIIDSPNQLSERTGRMALFPFLKSLIAHSASRAVPAISGLPRSTEKAYSGSSYYPFSSAAHVFTGAQMSLILTNNIVAVKFVFRL
jgi:hypothetical protein